MRLSDLCTLPLAALWQQKGRTVLTTLGVVFGSFVLTASLSTNQGVQDAIARELGHTDMLRRIQVRQLGGRTSKPIEVKGSMSAARRERIRQALESRRQALDPEPMQTVLNEEKLQAIRALNHVERVVPTQWQFGVAVVDGRREGANLYGVLPSSDYHSSRLVAGRFFDDPHARSAVVSEFLAYRFGYIDESAVNMLVGKKLRFEIRGTARRNGLAANRGLFASVARLRQQIPGLIAGWGLSAENRQVWQQLLESDVYSEEFTITGVSRLSTREEEESEGRHDPLRQMADVLLPVQTATDFYFNVPRQAEQGINALVIVDKDANVDGVLRRIKDVGLDGSALYEGIKRERLMYSLIFGGMTCIAAVALFVAALGIANTMLMSVLERMREIGVMKAVGATNGALQSIFLIEGALIGLVGGVLGLLLAWGASFPGDLWVRSMVSRDIKVELKAALFVFPSWLTLTVIGFTVVVTTLAAVYPAHCAAAVDPVTALRHE